MNKTATYHRRLGIVKRWLRERGWTPDVAEFNYRPVIENATTAWYPTQPSRAEAIVAKAVSKLRGEAVREAGRPPMYAPRLRIGQRVTVKDATSRREMTVTANGSRRVLTLQADDGSVIFIY